MATIPKLSVLADVWTHPANRGRKLRSVGAAVSWQIRQRVTSQPVDMTLESGSVMRAERGMPAAHLAAAYRGLYDYEEMSFLKAYLRPGDRVLDVGANAGVYALMTGPIIGASGRIDCFEPTPGTRRRLMANLALSGLSQVRIHPFACSDTAGEVSFSATVDDHTNQIASSDCPGTITVQTVRLDEVVGGVGYAVGKLDIEGAEPLALVGAEQMLASQNPPVWILELSWRVEQFGWTTDRFASWLDARGFDLVAFDPQTRGFVEADLTASHCNVFAVARDRREEVASRCRG